MSVDQKAVMSFRTMLENAQRLLTSHTLRSQENAPIDISDEELKRHVARFKKCSDTFVACCEKGLPDEV